ncbi:hypothetical protein BZG36_01711 [Bifiguratus adelaidae]|uniref:Uncharacterized protein n=1 Tax=Bifiguratus adelaidae TaxID=1938954 RepID=A0A261Y4J1_9FUNG|nr:hypothetical protein BZG36_01711 [Bifiguratus adelaidae]
MSIFSKFTKNHTQGPLSPDKVAYPWSQRRIPASSVTNPQSPTSHVTSPPAPAIPRFGHTADQQAPNGEIYLYGGVVRGQGRREALVFDTNTLQTHIIHADGDMPAPRAYHTMLVIRGHMIVFGGDILDNRANGAVAEQLASPLYILNISTRQWFCPPLDAVTGQAPPSRSGHTAVALAGRMFVFGGSVSGHGIVSDLCQFDIGTLTSPSPRWDYVDAVNEGPAPRRGHVALVFDQKMFIFGGYNDDMFFNDLWVYDPMTNAWSGPIQGTGYVPAPREGCSATMVDDVIYIFGGRKEAGEECGDLCAFRLRNRRWYMFQNMGPSPTPRAYHTLTAVRDKVYVLGGDPVNFRKSEKGEKSDEGSMLYCLDTGKIQYPPDVASSPMEGGGPPPLSMPNQHSAPQPQGPESPNSIRSMDRGWESPTAQRGPFSANGHEIDFSLGQGNNRQPSGLHNQYFSGESGPPDSPVRGMQPPSSLGPQGQRPPYQQQPQQQQQQPRQGRMNHLSLHPGAQLEHRPSVRSSSIPLAAAGNPMLTSVGPNDQPDAPSPQPTHQPAQLVQNLQPQPRSNLRHASVIPEAAKRRPRPNSPLPESVSGSNAGLKASTGNTPHSMTRSPSPNPSAMRRPPANPPPSPGGPPPRPSREGVDIGIGLGLRSPTNPLVTVSDLSQVNVAAEEEPVDVQQSVVQSQPEALRSQPSVEVINEGQRGATPSGLRPKSAFATGHEVARMMTAQELRAPSPSPRHPGRKTMTPTVASPITMTRSGTTLQEMVSSPTSATPTTMQSPANDQMSRVQGSEPDPHPALRTVDSIASISTVDSVVEPIATPTRQREQDSARSSPVTAKDSANPRHTMGNATLPAEERSGLIREIKARDMIIGDLRRKEQWWRAEVALARKSRRASLLGPEGESTNEEEPIMDVGDVGSDKYKVFDGLTKAKLELRKMKTGIAQQAQAASAKVALAERMRNAALQEAAYWKAKHQALKGDTNVNVASIETKRAEELEKQLSHALQDNESLRSKLSQVQKQSQHELGARQAAEENLKEAQIRADEASEAHSRVMDELSALHQRCIAAESKLREHELSLPQKDVELKNIKDDHSKAVTELEKVSAQVAQYEKAIEKSNAVAKMANRRASDAERMWSQAREHNADLEAQIASMRTELELKVSELARAQHLANELESLYQGAKDEVRVVRDMLDEQVVELLNVKRSDPNQANGHIYVEEIEGHKARIVELEKQLKTMEDMHKNMETHVTASSKDVADNAVRMAQLEAANLKSRNEVAQLKQRLSEAVDEVARLKTHELEKETALNDRLRDLEDADIRIGMMRETLLKKGFKMEEADLVSAKTDVGSRIQELERRAAQIMEQTAQTEQFLQDRIAQLEDEYEEAVAAQKNAEVVVRKLKAEVTEYQNRMDETEAELHSLHQRNDELVWKLAAMEQLADGHHHAAGDD